MADTDITLDEFRAEIVAFLDANATPKDEQEKFVWGEGSDDVALFDLPRVDCPYPDYVTGR